MATKNSVFLGLVVSPKSLNFIDVYNGFLEVVDGKIKRKGSKQEFEALTQSGYFRDYDVIRMTDNQFLMPGMVDCHTHAPQFPNMGLGYDRPLMEWLDTYTFPLESHYQDVEYAARVYNQVVQRLLKNGTTTACYFGTLHLNGTMELVTSVVKYNQRAFIGKVSMNVSNRHGYYNETKDELQQVSEFVKYVTDLKNDLVQPVVTPRFAVSCDEDLMKGLAQIAQANNCMTQSHISESKGEIEFILKTFKDSKSYTDVYDKCNILNQRCIMAHAVHLSEEEMCTLASKGVSIAHCPSSNTLLVSGLCPIRKILDHGIKVGLGTDVSGGDNATILDAMRRCMDVSTVLHMNDETYERVSWREAFYMATLGGAQALNLGHKTGNLEIGKEFDALVIDTYTGPIDKYEFSIDINDRDLAQSLLQRFIHMGDDRNILKVYVRGKEVKCNL